MKYVTSIFIKSTIKLTFSILLLLYLSIINTSFSIERIEEKKIEKNSLAPMLKKVLPTVVNIHVEGTQQIKKNLFPKEYKYFFTPETPGGKNNTLKQFEGLGSGVIINSEKGYIITNNHVICGADKINIQLNDGREFKAKLIGKDEQTDLALLQIPQTKNITSIKIADSDYLKVGDFAVAIGNPFGLGQTVTSGIISALGRSGLNLEGLENFIQTDASINRGNSGGALVNMNGELIGINTAILAPGGGNIGIGFAIPSNIVKNLSQQIIEYGKVKRGQLGIKGTELTSNIAKAFNIDKQKGAFVSEVIQNSAADKAGIKAGDIILSIEGKNIQSFSELRAKIGTTNPGKKIKIELLRNGKTKNVLVILDEQHSNTIETKDISITELQGAYLSNGELKNGIRGVKIDKVIKDSPAYSIGLQKDDMIVGINKEKIQNINQLKKLLNKKQNIIALNIIRNNMNIFLLLH
ncbi:MAG: periplasmic serine endoprotease [Candidatus Westeberhardia cardiocondylae]|nr:periplasmic serine endoprotease [Candidatus Westeberhardia cardiocondylae]